MKQIARPNVFRGKNFMTPDILGYYKLAKGYAELSRGTGFYGEPIFGVTVRPQDGRSKLLHSEVEAINYIKQMS